MSPLLALLLAAAPVSKTNLFDEPDGSVHEAAVLATNALRNPADSTLRRRALEVGVLSSDDATLAARVTRVAVRAQLGLDGGEDTTALRDWCGPHAADALCVRVSPWLDALHVRSRLPTGALSLERRDQPGACEALWYLDVGALPEAERVATLTLRDVNLPALGTVWRRFGTSDARIDEAKAAAAKSPTAWWAAFHGLLADGRWDDARAWWDTGRPRAPGPLHEAYAPALHALLVALSGDVKQAASENARVTLRLPAAPTGLFLAASYYVDGLRLQAAGKSSARAAFEKAREAIETQDPEHPLWALACAAEDGGTCQHERPRHRRSQSIEVYDCSK